ncbi:MAG: hypothetical protein PHF84_10895 [bacterium]|nr:hypothetical protein [bacterium]
MTIHTFIDALRELLIILPAIFLTITLHEYFLGFTAFKLGDITPQASGSVKFNPLLFIDNLGLINFILFHYGWSKTTAFDPRNFKRPFLFSVLSILAGMFSNFIAAFFFILLIILYKPNPLGYIYNLFMTIVQFNLNYFLLNLLPLLPLDGGKIISFLYPEYNKFEIVGIILLMLFFLLNLTRFFDLIVYNIINLFI